MSLSDFKGQSTDLKDIKKNVLLKTECRQTRPAIRNGKKRLLNVNLNQNETQEVRTQI